MSLVLQSSGGGSVTLAEPTTASNFTQDLPAVTGNVVIDSATQTLTNKSIAATQLTGTIAAARLPAGSVLQVVSFATTSSTSTTSGTPVETALTASITPTSSSSKIFVSFNAMCQKSAGSGIFSSLGVAIYKNAGLVIYTTRYGGYSGVTAALYMNAAGQYLDSPATTSSTTYTIYIFNEVSGSNVGLNNDSSTSVITLMEIAA